MYTLYTNSMSPYSSKASALLGYAGIPCREEYQNLVSRFTVLKRLTGKTMVPVLRQGEWAINDSTQIARWAQGESDQSLLPEREALAPICWLLEEFADEWLSRWVVLSRWKHTEDARELRRQIGREVTCGLPGLTTPAGKLTGTMIEKHLARGGVRRENRSALEQSRDRVLQGLENIFESADGYLFGGEPTVADFAFYGQLEQYRRDPTGSERMQLYPAIGEWLDRLDRMRLPHPVVAHRQDAGAGLAELNVLFGEFFGTYWRVLVDCHRARQASGGAEGDIEVELLDGTTFRFYPSGYLAGRLDFVLEQLEAACEHREALFGAGRLEWEEAIGGALDQLAAYREGRARLNAHGNLLEMYRG
jgi:glutathione S-transferase